MLLDVDIFINIQHAGDEHFPALYMNNELDHKEEPLDAPVETNTMRDTKNSFHSHISLSKEEATVDSPKKEDNAPVLDRESNIDSRHSSRANRSVHESPAKSEKPQETNDSKAEIAELVDNPEFLAESVQQLRRVRKDLNSNLSVDQLETLILQSSEEQISQPQSLRSTQNKLSNQLRDPPAPPAVSDVEHLKAIRRQVRLLFGRQSDDDNDQNINDESTNGGDSTTRSKALPPPPPGVRSPPRVPDPPAAKADLPHNEFNHSSQQVNNGQQTQNYPYVSDLPQIQTIGPTPTFPTQEMLDPYSARQRINSNNQVTLPYNSNNKGGSYSPQNAAFQNMQARADQSRNSSRVSWAREVLQASLRPQNNWVWGSSPNVGDVNTQAGNAHKLNNNTTSSPGKNNQKMDKDEAYKILEDMELLFGFANSAGIR